MRAVAGFVLFFFLVVESKAVEVSVYDSVVSLATNVTQNYTLNNPTSGLGVVVAVTMTPYSSVTNSPNFSPLDFLGDTPTRLGVDSGLGGGDGNWLDTIEGVNYTATLLSVSNGIVTNSIRFGITGIGIRPEGGPLLWTSSATTNSFTLDSEALATLDTNLFRIGATTYTGTLRLSPGDNRVQLSDRDGLAGQSFAITVLFNEGDGSPVVEVNPLDQTVCSEYTAQFTAEASGEPTPNAQWQVQTTGSSSYVDIPGATNNMLFVSTILTDSGSLYRAVFSNTLGNATTTVAALSVYGAPSSLIIPSSTNLYPTSATNTANAVPGSAGYNWTISNGSIIGSSTSTSITFAAGISGSVTLGLMVSNAIGCVSSSSIAIAIAPLTGVTGGQGLYVSDDGQYISKFDTNGIGSLFAITNLLSPSDMVFDRYGNLFVASYGSDNILKYDTNGNGSVFASGLDGPYGLAIDGNGVLFVSEYDDGNIRKIATNGSVTLFNTDTPLNNPADIAFDQAGYLYVADSSFAAVYKFDTNGTGTLFNDAFVEPYGIAFDSTGNLFVSDFDSGDIYKVSPDGIEELFYTSTFSPVGMAFDREGYLYVADEDTVQKIAPNGIGTTFADSGIFFAAFIAIWPQPSHVIPVNEAVISASSSSGQIAFSVNGSVGADYITQAATNLITPDWISLATNISPFIYIDTNAATANERYYRVIHAP